MDSWFSFRMRKKTILPFTVKNHEGSPKQRLDSEYLLLFLSSAFPERGERADNFHIFFIRTGTQREIGLTATPSFPG